MNLNNWINMFWLEMILFCRFVFSTNSETLEKVILRGSKDIQLQANESHNNLAETPYTKVYPGAYE